MAFLSELAALAAIGWWGWSVLGPVLAVLLVLAAAVLWGVVAAPRAPVRVPALAVVVKVLVFGAAVVALAALGHPLLAALLGVAAVLGSVLSPRPEELTPVRG